MKKNSSARTVVVRPIGEPIRVTMEWQPNLTVNHRYWYSRYGRPVLKATVRVWMEALAWEVRAAMGLRRFEPTQQFQIKVDFYVPTSARGDQDAYWKSLFDGIKLGLDVDDKHFTPVNGKFIAVPKFQARFEIEITPLGAAELTGGKRDQRQPSTTRG
ncbi:MAG TPA: RusA family crossover junction endodeoxyribonuclease [Anaerolineae bacterium]|nr:RusA family crossover junction endodeoxyribonuclease [Anaerolineae bacterium]